MPWWMASILANVCIMGVEYFNHAGQYGSWLRTLPRTGPLILVAQWGLYHAFSHSPNWLMAWAVFTVGNAVLRVGANAWLAGNQIASWWHVIIGVAVMLTGSLVMKGGLR